jgi:apolipoprotein N-acyltransferase
MRLVPFGEYVPLPDWPVFAGLTPYAAADPGYAHGDRAQPLMEFRGVRFGVLICYEDAFARLARRAVGRGAGLLVNLSSEAWFAGTSEIAQHLRIARFRAVESRVPLVRCCNVGVTCLIDPAGRIARMLEGSDRPQGARGFVTVDVPVPGGARGGTFSVHSLAGDAFALAASAAAAVLLALAAWRFDLPAPPACACCRTHGDR